MGLDMYLTGRVIADNVRDIIMRETDLLDGLPEYKGYDTASVNIPIYQWRKANAIHKWFVDNCADGIDDCRPVHVSRDNLEELREIITAAEVSVEAAKSNLPSESGFFFGSTEYDEYYFGELAQTKKMLDTILDNDNFMGWGFEYQASW